MTSKVIEGHKRYSLCLKIYFFQGGILAHRLSPLLPSPSLSLSFLSLLFFFFLSLFFIPPTPKSALYPPYASLSFLSLLFFSSLSLSYILTPTSALYPPYESLSFLSPLFFFYFNLNLRSYGQLFVLVFLMFAFFEETISFIMKMFNLYL